VPESFLGVAPSAPVPFLLPVSPEGPFRLALLSKGHAETLLPI